MISAVMSWIPGCASATWVKDPSRRTYTDPAYESSRPFLFWGLLSMGEDVVVETVCRGRGADQITTRTTWTNVLGHVFTLGIYAPKTVRIWCEL